MNKNIFLNLVSTEIGYGLVAMHGGQSYEQYVQARKILLQAGITRIFLRRRLFAPNEVVVLCKHPGHLIGKAGGVYDFLVNYLNNNVPYFWRYKLVIEETKELYSLYAYEVGFDYFKKDI